MRRNISLFGREEDGYLQHRIVDEAQERTINKLTADEFINTDPNVADGRGRATNIDKKAL